MYMHVYIIFMYILLHCSHPFTRSLGVTLWELCSCCQWPYEDMMNEEVIQYVKTNEGNVLDNPVEEGDTLFPM